MEDKIKLLALDDLPWDLGTLGIISKAELVMPDIYDAVLEQKPRFTKEVFLVHRGAAGISASAKRYGQPVENYPDYLVYRNCAGYSRKRT